MNSTEQKLYTLLTKEHLTIKQAARRINKSETWLYRVRKSLIRKGYLSSKYDLRGSDTLGGGGMGGTPFFSSAQNYRIHGEIFTIRLMGALTFGGNLNLVKYIDSNKYIVYNKSIVIYGLKSFYGSLDSALFEASKYWTGILLRLSSQIGINLLDSNLCSISLSRSHISKCNDPLAIETQRSNKKLTVRAHDGKIRLLVDNSYNLQELEAVDKRTNIEDIKAISSFMADILEGNHFKPSESKQWIEALKEISEHHAHQLREIKQTIAYIVSHNRRK